MSPRRVLPLLLSIAVVVPIGFYGKRLYHGPAAHWVNDSLGGVFYEILWCLVLALLLPQWKAARIALTVLVATCILEFLQLWHPPLLEWLRSFFIGRTILGSYFDWSDFPYYFIGSALGLLWVRALRRRPPLETRVPAVPHRQYLCIDLDGTLVLTDTFEKAARQLLRRSPWRFAQLMLWLLKGRPFLKRKVCEAAPLDPQSLPFNTVLIEYIRQQKANGSKIVLATGSDLSVATAIAAHLGIFDEVQASDGRRNLVGRSKAHLLAEKYPGFHYAGNSRTDLPVWKKSAGVIVVSDSAALLRRLKRGYAPILQVISPKNIPPLT